MLLSLTLWPVPIKNSKFRLENHYLKEKNQKHYEIIIKICDYKLLYKGDGDKYTVQ